MILWTMQPYEVYQQLKSQGYFFSDPNKSRLLEYEEFDKAYQWMIEQMKLKIGMPPKGVKTPIWAWYKRNYKHKRPDFRWVRDFDDEVCIEFEIPDDEVLLSDFMAWHFVLGDFCYSQIDDEKESKRFDDWFDSLPISEQKKIKEESWQVVFDITPRYGKNMNGDLVQACIWALKYNRVRKVWRLKKGEKYRLIE